MSPESGRRRYPPLPEWVLVSQILQISKNFETPNQCDLQIHRKSFRVSLSTALAAQAARTRRASQTCHFLLLAIETLSLR
jgi:hypothetical protein